MRYDKSRILVLGGGPAGGAAALEMAQAGCSVVLLERQVTPGWKIGETLPPEARVHLQRLKQWDTFRQAGHRPCYGIVSCWGSEAPVEVDFLRNPYGNGWQLDRVRFESDLLQAAQAAGCQVCPGTEVHSIQSTSRGWQIDSTAGDFHADWLLNCTGRNGILARYGLGGRFEGLQNFVCLYCVLNSVGATDHDGRTYVESHPSGWAYSALMPSGLRVVAFLTDGDLIPTEIPAAEWMRLCIRDGPQIMRLLESAGYAAIERVHLVTATTGRHQTFAGKNWILVGDAAMTFDPLSGWGATKAIVSAGSAAQLVLNEANYQAECEAIWESYLVQYRDFYLAEQRWPDAPFWSRRHDVHRHFLE